MTDRPMAAVTSREVLSAVGALAVAIALLPLLGGGVLWTRPLWLDEICCTVYPVSNAATPVAVVRNIVHREDYVYSGSAGGSGRGARPFATFVYRIPSA